MPVYPGPLPDDPPGWAWRVPPWNTHALLVVLRCALCGRRLGPRTATVFYDLSKPLGRMTTVGWHDACALREPLEAAMCWPRERDGAWGKLLRVVAARGPGRIGPGGSPP
jgi:hypothetical protein